jgi:hypothetical protein
MDRVSSTERTGKFSGERLLVVRSGSAWDYFEKNPGRKAGVLLWGFSFSAEG